MQPSNPRKTDGNRGERIVAQFALAGEPAQFRTGFPPVPPFYCPKGQKARWGDQMPQEDGFVARAFAGAADDDALQRLAGDLGSGPFALVVLFISPDADLEMIAARSQTAFPSATVIGCTTAGEITTAGYDHGTIVAIGFPQEYFSAETLLISNLGQIEPRTLTDAFLRARQQLAREHAHQSEEFSILLVDGLSVKEDELAAALAAGAGAMPLIGGSAGDGTRFQQTFILHDGALMQNAAVLAVLRTSCAVRPINLDHLTPTERRMVVTEADPRKRTVSRINAEPAAREYARLLGKDPVNLDTFTFAAHPLAVRMGRRHHVRAIQRILPSGDLVFFSAIDKGVVLTITEPRDLVTHLDQALSNLRAPAEPVAILAFECILRRIEAQEKQMTRKISGLMRQHGVAGFSTYGEQFGPMHVNHTLTGYAFYPPGTELPEDGT